MTEIVPGIWLGGCGAPENHPNKFDIVVCMAAEGNMRAAKKTQRKDTMWIHTRLYDDPQAFCLGPFLETALWVMHYVHKLRLLKESLLQKQPQNESLQQQPIQILFFCLAGRSRSVAALTAYII